MRAALLAGLLAATSARALPAAGVDLVVPGPGLDRAFRVGVTVRDVTDLFGAGIDIAYDATVVTVVDADANFSNGIQPVLSEGAFLNAGATTPTVSASALENGREGRLVIGLARRGTALGVSSASPRLLASVLFRGRDVASGQIRIAAAELRDSRNASIRSTLPAAADVSVVTTAPRTPPVARAGLSRTQRTGFVLLDGSESSDPDGDPITYSWSQTAGPGVALSGAGEPVASFSDAPSGVYAFRLTVSDVTASGSDDVTVTLSAGFNGRPVASVLTPAGSQSGAVPIDFVLADPDGDRMAAAVEFSTDGGVSFRAARPALAGGLTGLEAAPGGSLHRFLWNSVADIGAGQASGVRFRVTPSDAGGAGTAGLSDSFSTDNSGTNVAVRILQPASGSTFFDGQVISFAGSAADSSGALLAGASLVWRSSLAGAFASGATPATTLATGDHQIELTATDGQSRSATSTIALRVLPKPLPANLLAMTGRVTLSGTGQPVPPGTRIEFYNLVRKVSSGGEVASGDGVYEVVLSRADRPAAAPGDMLQVFIHDSQGVQLTAQPASLVLTLADFLDRIRVQDFRVLSRTSLELQAGINLLALPSDPSTTGTTFTVADFVRQTGSNYVVRIVPGRDGRGKFEVFMPGGAVPPYPLTGDQGYLVRMPAHASFVYDGGPWPSVQLRRRLHAGVNFVAFPRGVPPGLTVADLAVLANSSVVARFDHEPEEAATARRRFLLFSVKLPADPDPVENGKAYIVVVPRARDLILPVR